MKTLRIAAVSEKTGLATKTIRNWVTAGQFPRPFHLSTKIAVWDESDVDAYLLGKKQERSHDRSSGEIERHQPD
jgi:predicted DNA-binding transcriptional regulator AlpA